MTAFLLAYVNINAQCDYVDDFDRAVAANYERATSYTTHAITTVDGWGWNCVRHNLGHNFIVLGTGSTLRYEGWITSPIFNNGCRAIRFSVGNGFYDAVSFSVTITQEGATAWSSGNVSLSQTGSTTGNPVNVDNYIEWSVDDLTIEGDYQIKIESTSTGYGRSTAPGIYLKNLCITAATAQAPDAPSIDIAGAAKVEGDFWDKASVTLSHLRPDVSIYYTTDNTEPTDASTPYTAPFDIAQTTQLKAISVAGGVSSTVLDTLITVTASPYKITAPENATVFVGVPTGSGYNYRPFTEKTATYSTVEDGKKTYYYNVSGKHNYRVSRADAVTTVGVFTPSGTNTALEITEGQLTSHAPKEINHDVNSLNGRNVADIFVNINAAGHLYLPKIDTTFQIVSQRNWQTIDTDVNNYFFQPDFHYTVLGEDGAPSNAVLTVSPTGLITPAGEGTAIVLITYDALLATHTVNLGAENNGNAFFSALWPENTAVFVVTVGEKGAGIASNMTVSEYWNSDGTDKTDGIALDSEHDVLYYEASTGGFDYTFKPEGVLDVTLATPTVGTNSVS
ncbi:MAG: chitobiase/beta-hexosaminidase C-terminal domain-containing protein, partial [Bacteroidales bacterium]|nr:chitobiase/beta-hexosaminidase C-terminal domain-containing protein [Bacteroidales bacterium]